MPSDHEPEPTYATQHSTRQRLQNVKRPIPTNYNQNYDRRVDSSRRRTDAIRSSTLKHEPEHSRDRSKHSKPLPHGHPSPTCFVRRREMSPTEPYAHSATLEVNFEPRRAESNIFPSSEIETNDFACGNQFQSYQFDRPQQDNLHGQVERPKNQGISRFQRTPSLKDDVLHGQNPPFREDEPIPLEQQALLWQVGRSNNQGISRFQRTPRPSQVLHGQNPPFREGKPIPLEHKDIHGQIRHSNNQGIPRFQRTPSPSQVLLGQNPPFREGKPIPLEQKDIHGQIRRSNNQGIPRFQRKPSPSQVLHGQTPRSVHEKKPIPLEQRALHAQVECPKNEGIPRFQRKPSPSRVLHGQTPGPFMASPPNIHDCLRRGALSLHGENHSLPTGQEHESARDSCHQGTSGPSVTITSLSFGSDPKDPHCTMTIKFQGIDLVPRRSSSQLDSSNLAGDSLSDGDNSSLLGMRRRKSLWGPS